MQLTELLLHRRILICIFLLLVVTDRASRTDDDCYSYCGAGDTSSNPSSS
jgi:hypothetical protein